MSTSSTRTDQAVSGARWLGFSQALIQVLRTVVHLVLARLLTPDAFGLVAMALVVTNFLDIFRDLGTRTAIVQRASVSRPFLSSMFYFNAVVGGLLALLLLGGAPVVAAAFGDPQVRPIVQVLSLSLVLASWGLVHQGMLHREQNYRRMAATQIFGALAHGIVSLTLALNGFGVWSLVAGIIASAAATTLTAWILSPWHPSLHFSTADVRSVWGFSSNLSAAQIFNFFVHNADKFIIGRVLGSALLGSYNLAQRLVSYPVMALTQVIHNVLFASMARLQDDDPALQRLLIRSCSSIALVVFPMMAGLAVVASPFVHGWLGPEWSPAIFVLQILAPVWALFAISDTALLLFKVKGRTDLLLRWSVVSGSAMVLAYVIGLPWGLEGVAIGYGIAALVLAPVAVTISVRLVGLRVSMLLRPLLPQVLLTLMMVGLVLIIQMTWQAMGVSDSLGLLISVGGGIIAYSAATLLARPPALRDVLQVLGAGTRG